jgi:hypothetical protein
MWRHWPLVGDAIFLLCQTLDFQICSISFERPTSLKASNPECFRNY